MPRTVATHEIWVRKNSEITRDVIACSTNRDMITFVEISAHADHAEVVDLERLTAGGQGRDVREERAHGAVVEGLHEGEPDPELRDDEHEAQRVHDVGGDEQEQGHGEIDQQHLAQGGDEGGAVDEERKDGVYAEAEDHGEDDEPQDEAAARSFAEIEPELHASASTMAAAIVSAPLRSAGAANGGDSRQAARSRTSRATRSVNRRGVGRCRAVPVLHDMQHVLALVWSADVRDDQRNSLGDGEHCITGPALAGEDVRGPEDAADVLHVWDGHNHGLAIRSLSCARSSVLRAVSTISVAPLTSRAKASANGRVRPIPSPPWLSTTTRFSGGMPRLWRRTSRGTSVDIMRGSTTTGTRCMQAGSTPMRARPSSMRGLRVK